MDVAPGREAGEDQCWKYLAYQITQVNLNQLSNRCTFVISPKFLKNEFGSAPGNKQPMPGKTTTAKSHANSL
jgi:hypothetical protein